MFFTKYPSPANFAFPHRFKPGDKSLDFSGQNLEVRLENFENGVASLSLVNRDIWPVDQCLDPLDIPQTSDQTTLRQAENSFELLDSEGKTVLRTVPEKGIGLNGHKWLIQLDVPEGCRYYGMGEKLFGKVELSGYRTVFWNTDVWSDFHWAQWGEHPSDPPYFSLPYVAVKLPSGHYVGILVHDPSPVFMETPGKDDSRVFVEWQRTAEHLIIGAYNGEPNLWFIVDTTLAGLTQKLNKLVGVTPRPPLWSLGYHQSRWGYGGEKDLFDLDANFTKHQIPCSGLWLDLDYMTGFRIFKTDKKMFPNGVQSVADKLAKSGRRIVPIIDPGVKFEPGYNVYDDGHKQNVFCKTPHGSEYIGMVWPGQTVFPDFSVPRVRDWWADYAAGFRKEGFGACWVDMNDPSTGPIDPDDMYFDEGRRTHEEHRNQYALGMQMATFQGFLKSNPDERPFMLSRSGFIGSSRYAAIWTGDNLSNDFYLQSSITTCLGMALSGHVFNGPDVGGFGGSCTPRLLERWMQAGFLFPFFRNHTGSGTRAQEPFSYPDKTCKVAGHYIRLRYRFLPYLYNLFIEHEKTGAPVLRPLFYEFDQKHLDEIDDQFLVGPSVLQAPIVAHREDSRTLRLPGRQPWFDARTGTWTKPGTVKDHVRRQDTPLFLRAGSIIPLQSDLPTETKVDLLNPIFLLAFPENSKLKTTYRYVADDGLSYGYQSGKQSVLEVTVSSMSKGLEVTWNQTESGFGDITPVFVTTLKTGVLKVNGVRARKAAYPIKLTGKTFSLTRLD